MTRTIGLLGLAMALCGPGAVRADVGGLGGVNQLLNITGQVSATEEAAQQFGYSAISIGFAEKSPKKLVWMGVVKAATADGDEFKGRNIIALIQGYKPNLLAGGKNDPLAKLRAAPVGSSVTISGIVDTQARNYLVNSVRVTPPAGK